MPATSGASAAAPAPLLSLPGPGGTTVRWGALDIARLAPTEFVERRALASSGGGAGNTEESVRYRGVLLRDALLAADPQLPQRRDGRTAIYEVVARDGYRAVFSWGELFNSPAGERVLVVLERNGAGLDDFEGPLALRALGDSRPGPRHVRQVCAVASRVL